MRVRFGDFVLDAATRELMRGGTAVHLSPKAFRLLEALLQARPAVVPGPALREILWPSTFVHEANLPNLVVEVRTALGDEARAPRFVRTVHGCGYAFCGTAMEEAPAPVATFLYRLESPHESVSFGDGEHVVGRSAGSGIRLRSRSVSRRHALLRARAGRVEVEDLGSRNGTFVKGTRLSGPAPLASGDDLRVGALSFTFVVCEPAAATEATEAPEA